MNWPFPPTLFQISNLVFLSFDYDITVILTCKVNLSVRYPPFIGMKNLVIFEKLIFIVKCKLYWDLSAHLCHTVEYLVQQWCMMQSWVGDTTPSDYGGIFKPPLSTWRGLSDCLADINTLSYKWRDHSSLEMLRSCPKVAKVVNR